MNAVKVVSIVTLIVFIFIYCVTNERVKIEINNCLNYKIKKIKMKDIYVVLILIIIILYSAKMLFKSKEYIDFLNTDMQSQLDEINDQTKIAENQNKKYKELINQTVDLDKCKNPYILDGFKYVEGEWNTGFVIEDEVQNQFVWVPCTNSKNEEKIPLLKKQIFFENNMIYFNCYEKDDYEEFIKSSLENGGFYISRFEIGNENEIPVSKKDVNIWTNVTYEEAENLSENMYSNINSKLINGYAIDTAISFIFDDIYMKKYKKTTGIAGNVAYKNIYDLIDNMNEWTSEMKYGENIYRGTLVFDENLEKYADILFNDTDSVLFVDRFVYDDKTDNLGFRTIIYK